MRGDSQKNRRARQRRIDISHAVTKALEVWGDHTRYTAETTLAREIERELGRQGLLITRKPGGARVSS